MKQKSLALDLDGTAVKDDYSMSLSSIKAIKKTQDNGHIVAYVSGRRCINNWVGISTAYINKKCNVFGYVAFS